MGGAALEAGQWGRRRLLVTLAAGHARGCTAAVWAWGTGSSPRSTQPASRPAHAQRGAGGAGGPRTAVGVGPPGRDRGGADAGGAPAGGPGRHPGQHPTAGHHHPRGEHSWPGAGTHRLPAHCRGGDRAAGRDRRRRVGAAVDPAGPPRARRHGRMWTRRQRGVGAGRQPAGVPGQRHRGAHQRGEDLAGGDPGGRPGEGQRRAGLGAACALLDVQTSLTRQARIASGIANGCNGPGQRWVIAPGAAPARAPSTWPGTDLAAAAGLAHLDAGHRGG